MEVTTPLLLISPGYIIFYPGTGLTPECLPLWVCISPGKVKTWICVLSTTMSLEVRGCGMKCEGVWVCWGGEEGMEMKNRFGGIYVDATTWRNGLFASHLKHISAFLCTISRPA